MRSVWRGVAVAAMVVAPFVVSGTSDVAEATCRPEKPSTCEPYCPGGSRRVGPVTVCNPVDVQEIVDLDCTCPPL